ncbi:MAG: tetratricopeptide repeat protein [Acidobacteriota bacterium]
MPTRVASVLFLSLGLFLFPCRALAADTWTEVKSDNFTVVSNAGDKKARNVAWQFEQVRSAIRQGFPWAAADLNRPMVIIAAKDEDTMRKLAPEYWEKRGETRPAAVSVSGWDSHYIAVRADLQEEGQGQNPYRHAYWSYSVLVFEENFNYRLPLWLSIGVASLLSNTTVSSKEIQFGVPIPEYIETLRTSPIIPLPQLLAVTRDSPAYQQSVGRERLDAQCWALLQFLMFSQQGGGGGRVNQLSALLLSGMPSAQAVQQVYGGIDALDQAYRLYVHQSIFRFGRLKVDTDTSTTKYPARVLTPAEGAAVQAALHVAMGRPVEARAMMAQARAADPAIVAPDDLDAILLDKEKKTEDARAAYAKAVERGSKNFWVYYRLASLSSGSPMDAAAMADMTVKLERSTALNPRFAPAFDYLANMQARQRQFDRALETQQKAVALASNDVALRINLARLLLTSNRRDDAVKVVNDAMSLARSDQERNALRTLIPPVAGR